MSARDDERAARRDAVRLARAAQTPPGPAPDRFRVVSWNVNSLKARAPGVERFLVRTTPHVVALQETRAAALVPPAAAMFDRLGYHVGYKGSGTWNGVAIVSTHPLRDIVASGDFGVEVLDRQARLIAAVVDSERSGLVRIVDVYAPHGREPGHDQYAFKLAFYEALTDVVAGWVASGPPVLLAGDVNVAPTDADVFHPDAFVGRTHVTPPERAALARLLDLGLVDLDAARWGDSARRFTWWDIGLGYARNLGMRIDVLAAERALADRLDTTWIDHVVRSDDRPSDHAPLIADFHAV
jgi:exodeoxyribonuclease-3